MEQLASMYPAWVTWITLLLVAWALPWKGVAMWRSARNGSKIWFVVFLLVNTLAVLEIIYIFAFSKKKTQS